MSFPQFDPAEFANLAKLILYEHRKCFPHQFPSHATLQQMLSAILLAHENKFQTQLKLRQTEVQRLAQENFSSQDEHIHHLEKDSQIGMQNKEVKILKRFANAKNEAKLQLQLMTNRYNKLIGAMLELTEKHETLKIELESARNENKKNVQKFLLKDSRIASLEGRIGKMVQNETWFKKQYSHLKKQQDQVTKFMKSHLRNFQSLMVTDLKKIFDTYSNTMANLTRNFKEIAKENDSQLRKQQAKLHQSTTLISQLVYDLGEATNFKKKSDEEVEEWIQRYREFNLIKRAAQKNSVLRVNVMNNIGLDDNAKFILEARKFLSRYK